MMTPTPSTLTELDEHFKSQGMQVVVNMFQYHVENRNIGERIDVTIEASGFRVNELHNLTPAEDLKNFDNILKEAIDHKPIVTGDNFGKKT